ncbi:hAT transposon superfamily protein, partial [Trifolium medium]|nr:hAT transposon superfamily protein [Trifolium medium]
TDPAWEHGVLIDEATTRVRCNYCQRDFTGGAHRLKHHLAGTSRDIKSCKSVPDDVKETMEDIMNGLRKKMLKKKCIDIEGDVDEAEVAANSNGKRKSVGEIALKDMFKRGLTTLTLI